MIDLSARNKMAEAARHYLTGISTNFVFDDAIFGLESCDLAIDAIRNQLWLIYDDLLEHRHEGRWKISEKDREIILRTIIFLKSDFEFQWPIVPSWYTAIRPIILLLTLGFGTKALDKRFEFKDRDNVWPFRNRDELNREKSNPKYFASAT